MSTSDDTISDKDSWESESSDLESNSDSVSVVSGTSGSSSECESDSGDSKCDSSDTTETLPSESSATSSDSECSIDVRDPESEQTQAVECPLASLSEFHTPLYECADLSVLDSYLLLYQYNLRHCITKQAFTELIGLVDAHLPRNAKSASSLYKLKKYFEAHFNDIECQTYNYCEKCHRLLDTELETAGCSNGCGGSSVKKFLYIPIENQLKKKLEDPFMWAQLQSRFNHSRDDTIRDIFDGREYHKHVQSGFLSEQNKANVSLTLNTDGVEIYKSSKYSLWPIWLQINELPPIQRYSKQNMLLAGLWYDNEKPTMTTFLYPLMSSVNRLFQQGIEVSTPDGVMEAHAVILICSVDLPAQAKVLNMKQYNGKFACPMCEDEGVPRPRAPMIRNWPFNPSSTFRTHNSVMGNAKKAIDEGHAVKGIKGASVFLLHSPFDVVKGVAVDSLHIVFLGVVSDLLKFWFDKVNRSSSYSIYNKINECDARLLGIKVPDVISRPPKSLQDYSHWKGAQLREWLLYYSLPVLHGMLSAPLLDHYCFLVTGVHILLSDAITEDQLSCAEHCFNQFYSQYSTIYGANANTMKVHLLNHIVSCVREWGPLWVYSCFHYEAMNHSIKKLFHGSRNSSEELAFNHTLLQALPPIISWRSSMGKDRVQVVLDKMRGKNRKHSQDGLLGEVAKSLTDQEVLLINAQLQLIGESAVVSTGAPCTVAYRLVKRKTVFYSSKYKRIKKRNSSTVVYQDSDSGCASYGQIQFFASVSNRVFVLVSQFKVLHVSCQSHFGLSHDSLDKLSVSKIIPIESNSGELVCIPASQLQAKCIFVSIENSSSSSSQYVVTFPNNLLYD